MEGYFVRTLGMHRVYNSAFMNMMRDEENAKYRSVIKNTIEFDPDIMKRYVNFMSNPDERTAIDQFGTGDKCFGVATVMATLPGLPMFGHGQIEGYTEKYGMEYRWPRYQENPDPRLIERHEREIAPLLHQRTLFAESSNFLLYDFFRADGSVDENVFAYSNRRDGQRALVIYNNRYSTTSGTIDNSAAYSDKQSGHLRQRRLREGLELKADPALVFAYRDSLTGLEYLRRSVTLADRGLTIELHAYQCHVFLDWRELHATAEKPWDRLCDHLAGRGVPKLDDALIGLALQPVHDALRRLLDPAMVRKLAELYEHAPAGPEKQKVLELEREEFFETAWRRGREVLREARAFYRTHNDGSLPLDLTNPASMAARFRELTRAAMRIPALEALFPEPWPLAARRVLPSLSPRLTATAMWGPVLAWSTLELLAESVNAQNPQRAALDLFDRLRLREPLAHVFESLGFAGEESWQVAARIKVALLIEARIFEPVSAAKTTAPVQALATLRRIPVLSAALWQDPDVRWLTGAHDDAGRSYFVKESYEELLWWLQLPALCKLAAQSVPARSAILAIGLSINEAMIAAASAGYSIDALFESSQPAREPASPLAPTVKLASNEEPAEDIAPATNHGE